MTTEIKITDLADKKNLMESASIMKLLKLPGGAETIVRFVREHDEKPEDDTNHIELLEMDRALWEDHGKPELGTVIFIPRDTLNNT